MSGPFCTTPCPMWRRRYGSALLPRFNLCSNRVTVKKWRNTDFKFKTQFGVLITPKEGLNPFHCSMVQYGKIYTHYQEIKFRILFNVVIVTGVYLEPESWS